MIWIVDRIENDIAVVEIGEKTVDIPLFALPENTKEGDVITLNIDENEAKKRKDNITNLMNTLFKD